MEKAVGGSNAACANRRVKEPKADAKKKCGVVWGKEVETRKKIQNR